MERALSIANSYWFGRQHAASKQERKEALENGSTLDQGMIGYFDRLDATP
jgi:hypothetical protein